MEKNSYKRLEKLFLQLARTDSNAFTHFVNYCIYVCSMKKIKDVFREEKESVYLEMFQLLGDSECQDFLGTLFEEYVSRGLNGQFFTPMPIADMLSKLTLGMELQNNMSVCDPACGSGRMILGAHRKALLENKRIYGYGSDIDHLCVKMAVINCFLHSIFGEIAWMNTLTMEFYKSYEIRRGFFNFPILIEINEKEKSNFFHAAEIQFDDKIKAQIQIQYENREYQQLQLF